MPLISAALQYTPNFTIPGVMTAGTPLQINGDTIFKFISGLYNFSVAAGGTIAVVLLLWAGLKWISAGGNPSQVESAKETIYSALLGLLLLIGSWALLNTVNPDIVNQKTINLNDIGQVKSSSLGVESNATDNQSGTTSPSRGLDGTNLPSPLATTDTSNVLRPGIRIMPNGEQCIDDGSLESVSLEARAMLPLCSELINRGLISPSDRNLLVSPEGNPDLNPLPPLRPRDGSVIIGPGSDVGGLHLDSSLIPRPSAEDLNLHF